MGPRFHGNLETEGSAGATWQFPDANVRVDLDQLLNNLSKSTLTLAPEH